MEFPPLDLIENNIAPPHLKKILLIFFISFFGLYERDEGLLSGKTIQSQ